MPENTVYVGRPTKWGNPYHLDLFGGDEQLVMTLYRRFLTETPIGQDLVSQAREKLRGKNLACFCSINRPCHADILLELANAD